MLILSLKEGHDGAVAAVEDGKLLFSLEAEKDSFTRYSGMTAEVFAVAADRLDKQPDVVAMSGWIKGTQATDQPSRSGYFGVGNPRSRTRSAGSSGRPCASSPPHMSAPTS